MTSIENISHAGREVKWSEDEGEILSGVTGVLNPTTCLHLGDILLFTVSTDHYPQYDV